MSLAAAVRHPASGLELRLAGGPQLRRDGQPLNTGSRKALALALMAALEPGVRRSRVAGLIWPDRDSASARRNIRRDLFRLRQIGLQVLDGPDEALTLADADIEWPRPSALPPRWLDGLDEVAGTDFEQWVAEQREQLHRRWIERLAQQARALEVSGDSHAALHSWRALLADGVAGPAFAEARAALERLQGSEGQAAASEAPGRVTAAPLRLPLIGREAELRAIAEALAQGKQVFIDGSPGIGKTTLALEALARIGGAAVLRCRPEDSAVPYAGALRGLTALREAAPDVDVAAWVQRDLAALVPEWADRSGEPPVLDVRRARHAYHAALCTLAEGNFGGLLIDDWQWADEPSTALWEITPDQLRGLPCLLLHRSGELPLPMLQRRRAWLDEGRAVAVHVGPLPDEQALALLRAALGDEAANERWADVVGLSGGNPLFLIELLRHRRQRADAVMPGSVQEIIVGRARALGPTVRRVLELASVAEDELLPALLADAAAIDELAVAQALEHATSAELLVADTRGRHRFAHDLIAQAIADSLTAVRREALHAALAAALGRRGAEPGQVARHYEQAGRIGDAAPWRLRAAEVALQRAAWSEALAAADAVLQGPAPPPVRLQAHRCRARAHRRLPDIAAAERDLESAMAEAARVDAAAVIDVWLERAELLTVMGQPERGLSELDALESDPALQPAQRAVLLRHRAGALGVLGRHGDAMTQLRRLLAETSASDLLSRQRVLSQMARCSYWAGDQETHRRTLLEWLALSRSLGDETAIANAVFRLGVCERDAGSTEGAVALFNEAAERAQRCGNLEILRGSLTSHASLLLDRMQLEPAEALLQRCRDASPYWDTPTLEDVYDDRLLRLHLLRGNLAAAREVCERSLDRHRRMQHVPLHLGTLMHAVHLSLALGETDRARRELDEAQALLDAGGGASMYRGSVALHTVEVLLAEGRGAEALAHAQSAIDRIAAAAEADPLAIGARLWIAAAQASLACGDPVRATVWLDEAARRPELPDGLTAPTQARWLVARLHCVRCGSLAAGPEIAAATQWLAGRGLPTLEVRALREALAAACGSPS